MRKVFIYIALLMVSHTAFSQEITLDDEVGGYYGGASFRFVTYEEDGFPDITGTMLQGRVGKKIHENFSLESRVHIGLSGDSFRCTEVFYDCSSTGNFTINVDFETGYSLLAKLHSAKTSANFSAYFLVGWSQMGSAVTVPVDGVDVSVSDSESGLSYGFGAEYEIKRDNGKDMSFNIEYMTYDTGNSNSKGHDVSFGANFPL